MDDDEKRLDKEALTINDSHEEENKQLGSPSDIENNIITQPKLDNEEEPKTINPSSDLTAKHKIFGNKKVIIITMGTIVTIVIIALGYFLFIKNINSNDQQNNVEQQTASEEVHTEEIITPTSLPNADAIWESQAVLLANQPLFDTNGLTEYYGGEVPENPKYYKVGTDNGKEIIIFSIVSNGIGDINGAVVKDKDSYKIIKKNTASFFDEEGTYYGPKLANGVTIDDTTAYNGLTPGDTITYNNVKVSRSSDWAVENDDSDLTEVANIKEGKVYERIYTLDDQQGIKQYYIVLKQPSHTYVKYRYATVILKDDNSATIKWKDGRTTNDTYQWAMVWGGCGNMASVNVLDKAYFGDLVEAGESNGNKIYTVNKSTHPVMNTVYKNYNADGSLPGAPTQQQMFDDKGVIVVRNELGYRVVLVNDKYQRAGECGKPVIYLYPESPLALSVRVGADITKSEPTYNDSWNVFAMPDGRLITSGGTYDSLFWEGIGHGEYPQVKSGFIVKRSDVEQTLWQHLKMLGLNKKESSDFMDFWMPLMPNTNYIRLTWFGTDQMNELAPLSLTKAPDTLIRIFLDFEGLDNPINIPNQRLSHPSRNGFVVVEWGGLLTNR